MGNIFTGCSNEITDSTSNKSVKPVINYAAENIIISGTAQAGAYVEVFVTASGNDIEGFFRSDRHQPASVP